MKVVSLISGGKDSCYNSMRCKEEAHEIICLANLMPANGPTELDSYMYQTVGSEGIEAIAKASKLPLIRKEIKRMPINLHGDYEFTENDEVEDLYELLCDVKLQFPDVEGVSVGAINSTYQKQRVEDVCKRLDLKPLCYLWEEDQIKLLDSMISAGIDAIIIKVAALGLSIEHLGMSIKEIRPILHDLHNKYGNHVCGEGGEFETFVTDCPLYFERISIEDREVINHSENSIAPIAYLRFNKICLTEKNV